MEDTEKKNTRHGNGHGYLEKKPNGVYIVRWTKDGKRFARSTGETDLIKAEEKRIEIMNRQQTICHEYKDVKIRKDIYDCLVGLSGGKSISNYLEKVVLAGGFRKEDLQADQLLDNSTPAIEPPAKSDD